MAISKNARVAKQAEVTKGVEIFYGTKPEWVVRELGKKLSDVFPLTIDRLDDDAVLCKEERGEYITGKRYIGKRLLDPYRMYRTVPNSVVAEVANVQ